MQLKRLKRKRKFYFYLRNLTFISIIFLLITQVLYAVGSSTLNLVTHSNLISLDEPVSFLFSGSDSSSSRNENNDWVPHGDAQILVTLSPNNARNNIELDVVSIPRDTRVPITCDNNTPGKINSAMAIGYDKNKNIDDAIECNLESVEAFTGINIDYYVSTVFDGFISLVDGIEGIDLTIPYPFCEQDANDQADNICFESGLQHLDGEHALAYARMRHAINPATGISGDDWERNIRQQEVIMGIAKKIFTDPSTYGISAANAINDQMKSNMSLNQIIQMINFSSKLFNQTVDSLTTHQNIELLMKSSDFSRKLDISPYDDLLGIKYDTQSENYLDELYPNDSLANEIDYYSTFAIPLHIDYRSLNFPTSNTYKTSDAKPELTIELFMTTMDTTTASDGSGDELVTKDERDYFSSLLARCLNQTPDISIPTDYYYQDQAIY